MKTYEQHPIGKSYPALTPEEFEKLQDMILHQHGTKSPVFLYEGKILDGWHWYKKCQELGISPIFEEYTGADPVGFVIGRHEGRRHLAKGQLAFIGEELATLKHGSNRFEKSRVECHSTLPNTRTEIADQLKITPRLMDYARSAKQNAIPEVIQAGKTGQIGPGKADKISRLPKSEQPAALASHGKQTKKSKPKPAVKKTSPFDSPEFQKLESEAMAKVNASSIYPEDAEWPVHPNGKVQTDYIQEAIRKLRQNEPNIWEMSWKDIFHEDGKIWLFTQRIQTYGLQSAKAVGATRGPIDQRLVQWAENVANKARARESYLFEKSRIRKVIRAKAKDNPSSTGRTKSPKRSVDRAAIFGQKLRKLLTENRFTAADKETVLAEAETVLRNYFEERWAEYAKSSGALKTNGATNDH